MNYDLFVFFFQIFKMDNTDVISALSSLSRVPDKTLSS